jgi:hypothetical protein
VSGGQGRRHLNPPHYCVRNRVSGTHLPLTERISEFVKINLKKSLLSSSINEAFLWMLLLW